MKIDKNPCKSSDISEIHCNDKNLENALLYTKYLFSILGIWSTLLEKSSLLKKIVSYIIMSFNFFSITFLVIVNISFAIAVSRDTTTIMFFIMTITFKIACLLKYSLLLLRSDLIKCCINYTKLCWSIAETNDEKNVLIKCTKFGKKLTLISGLCMYTAGIFFIFIIPFSKPRKLNEFNVTIKPLAFPGYDQVFNTQITPNYQLIYFWMAITAFLNYTVVIVTSNLAAVFETHVIGLIEIIILRLKNLICKNNSNNKNKNFDKKLACIIKFHVTVIRFAETIEKLLSEICLLEVILSTSVICLIEYFILLSWTKHDVISLAMYLLMICSLSFSVFIFCYIGQYMQDTCLLLKREIYMTNWYDVHKKSILALVLLITMAESPRKLTAGGMMTMCLQSYGETIKSSFVYFNYLRTFAMQQ